MNRMDRRGSRKEKKVDYDALRSALMHIPRIDVGTVRDLLDLGFETAEDLNGRSPEVLFQEIVHRKPETPTDRLLSIRMAVYFAETLDPDPKKMHPWAWRD